MTKRIVFFLAALWLAAPAAANGVDRKIGAGQLANSCITLNGHAVCLGGVGALAPADLGLAPLGASGAAIPLLNGSNIWSPPVGGLNVGIGGLGLTPYGGEIVGEMLTTADPGAHAFGGRTASAIVLNVTGSGVFGAANVDSTQVQSIQKNCYVSTAPGCAAYSLVDGEIDGLRIVTRQGVKGDMGGILIDAQKSRTLNAPVSMTASLSAAGVLTVSSVAAGALRVGDTFWGAGLPGTGGHITSFISGALGGAGQYQTDQMVAVTSEGMSAQTDSGGVTPIEMGSRFLDTLGNTQQWIDTVPAFSEGAGGAAGGTGYGLYVSGRAGTVYSAYHAETRTPAQDGFAAYNGYISGNTLTASSISGALAVNQAVNGAGVAAGTIITGVGGAGVYAVNIAQTVGSAGAPVAMAAAPSGGWQYLLDGNTGEAAANQYFAIRGDTVTGVQQPGDIVQGLSSYATTIRTTPDGIMHVRATGDSADILALSGANGGGATIRAPWGGLFMQDSHAPCVGGYQRIVGDGTGNFTWQVNVDSGCAYASGVVAMTVNSGGGVDFPHYLSMYGNAVANVGTAQTFSQSQKFSAGIVLAPVAIAALPACNSGAAGTYATVSNGVAAPTYMGAVSATGSSADPVFCNGSIWVYH